jgi:hypothetical protein
MTKLLANALGKLKWIIGIVTISLLQACPAAEIGQSEDINPKAIFQKIMIDCDEQMGTNEAKIQFLVSGSNGTTLVLNQPSKIIGNGKLLNVDSTHSLGAYYAIKGGYGNSNYEFIYVDKNNQKYTNSYTVNLLQWVNSPSQLSSKQNTKFQLLGGDNGQTIHVSIKDTANSAVHIETNLKNGEITIPASKLSGLSEGKVLVEIKTTITKKLAETTPEGGTLYFNQALTKRTLRLVKN